MAAYFNIFLIVMALLALAATCIRSAVNGRFTPLNIAHVSIRLKASIGLFA